MSVNITSLFIQRTFLETKKIMILPQLAIGTILILLTVVVHALILDRVMVFLDEWGPEFFKRFKRIWKSSIISFAVLCAFVSHIIQILIWAFFYIEVGVFDDFEIALYFSTTTYTTVGYGDVFLDKDWRLISAFQSANGLLLFGWSAAFIFEVMSKLYKRDTISKTEDNNV